MLELVKVVISVLENIENINMTAEIIQKNKENLTLLKECQLANTNKSKWNLRNGLLLYNIRLIILKR